MTHQHTEECLNGCTHLAALNQMIVQMWDYQKDKEALDDLPGR